MYSALLQQSLAQAGGSNPGGQGSSHALQQLRPMHLPEIPGAWPLAPGWWLLAAAVLVLAYILWRILQGRRKSNTVNRYRRHSLSMLQALQQRQPNNGEAIAELNQLLKRCAIQAYGRTQVSALSGQSWLNFLQRQALEFNPQAARLLIDGPYLPAAQLQNIDLQPLYLMSADWIQNHRGQDARI